MSAYQTELSVEENLHKVNIKLNTKIRKSKFYATFIGIQQRDQVQQGDTPLLISIILVLEEIVTRRCQNRVA